MLTVSILGAPGIALTTIVDWLAEAGIHGLELRLSTGEPVYPAMPNIESTRLRHQLEHAGVRITGLASYTCEWQAPSTTTSSSAPSPLR
jgi:sugar phosphate isomerase/epimerase